MLQSSISRGARGLPRGSAQKKAVKAERPGRRGAKPQLALFDEAAGAAAAPASPSAAAKPVAAATVAKAAPASVSPVPAAPEPRPRRATAEALAGKQREISVSEFFVKNRHLLGFDNPSKALLTTIKEAVDNSLDACEEA